MRLPSFKKIKAFDYTKYYPLVFTIVFVFILFQYSFSTLEAIFYDWRIKFDWGVSHSDSYVLVTIDEESDEYLGETYPYTYSTHFSFLEKILTEKPLLLNYFVQFQEPESGEETENQFKIKQLLSSYQEQGGIFRFGTDMDAWDELAPPQNLADLGHSLALINADTNVFAKDEVSRRAILNISGNDSLHLWSANKIRERLGKKSIDAAKVKGSYYLVEADATFSLFRYFLNTTKAANSIQEIPFHRVRVGNYPPDFFKDKIVLVGPSYLSNASDYVLTPFNKEDFKSTKLSLHAAIIEALVQGKTVYQVPRTYSFVISLLMAIILSMVISRTKPTTGLLITISFMCGIFLISNVIFSVFGIWLYISHLVLTVFVVYYIWVPFRAIGEYQTRYKFQEEAKILKKVEHLKRNFISLMSHDLKTPVAKVAGIADIMLKQKNDLKNYDKNLHSIIDSTKELNKFITTILDLTKIESSNLNINLTTKDINNVIEGSINDLRYEASVKEIEVNADLSPLFPIQFDINLIKRVLSNLIENAIKYSEKGCQVEVKSWDDDIWVYIEVKDNGIGIPEKDLEHIFEKFYRVKNDTAHSVKGSGLGLYLVKYFVELHGGEISANSLLGEGTSFIIKLKNK